MKSNTTLKKYVILAIMLSMMMSSLYLYSVRAETNGESEEVNFISGELDEGMITCLDPIMNRKIAEYNIIEQVVEPLFGQEVIGGPFTPLLALTQEWINVTTLDVVLRQEVTFTDGTAWNATAAQWNYDRLINSIYWGSNYGLILVLPSDGFRTVEGVDLSWLPEGNSVFVINHTEVVDEYTFRFVFNVPFDMSPIFLSLGMQSPTAHAEFFNVPMKIDNGEGNLNWTFNDGLVGTGAYTFESYNAQDGETKMWANMDYWAGVPYITNLTYAYLESASALHTKIMAEEVDLITVVEDPSAYVGNETIIYEKFGGKFHSFNVVMYDTMPVHVREAFNYAWNYDYYHDEVMKGARVRATGVVFPGVEYYNPEINLPNFNITRARQALIDGGLVDATLVANWTDADWQAKADGNDPFEEYGIYYITPVIEQAEETREAGRRLGIKVNLEFVEAALYSATTRNPNRTDYADMHVGSLELLGDFQTYTQFVYKTGAYYNLYFRGDSEVDAWIEEYVINVDRDDRQVLVDKIADKIQNELYWAVWTDGNAISGAYNRKWDNINLFTRDFYKITLYEEGEGEATIPGYPLFCLFGAITIPMTVLLYKRQKQI